MKERARRKRDAILEEMGEIPQRDHGTNDVSCQVKFVRDGEITTFDDCADG